MLNAKCPLTLERDETDPLNYFKPGDYLITGITPATTTMFRPFTFRKAPTNKVIWLDDRNANVDPIKMRQMLNTEEDKMFHPFLQDSQFYNASIDGIYLDENGELAADLDIVNWVKFSNKSVVNVKFGSIARQDTLQDVECQVPLNFRKGCDRSIELLQARRLPHYWNHSFDNHYVLTIHFQKGSNKQSYLFHPFLQDSQFYNASIDGIYLDENGELAADLDIVNWVKFSNKSVVNVKFGSIARQGSSKPLFKIDNEAIIWPKWLNQIPCKMLNSKCPLTLEQDDTDPLNYFKPGDYLITGITPLTTTMFQPFTFKKAPTNKVICYRVGILAG
ncbi:hypothetical protein E2320_014509 [Naja naja]|nr:hypothetical protein E2320_014509 [Naja naja]